MSFYATTHICSAVVVYSSPPLASRSKAVNSGSISWIVMTSSGMFAYWSGMPCTSALSSTISAPMAPPPICREVDPWWWGWYQKVPPAWSHGRVYTSGTPARGVSREDNQREDACQPGLRTCSEQIGTFRRQRAQRDLRCSRRPDANGVSKGRDAVVITAGESLYVQHMNKRLRYIGSKK